MAEMEISWGKSGRRAYGFDEIAIVASRRTRDVADVDVSWQIDAYRFAIPGLAAAMDGVTSPTSAIRIGELGGVGVLHAEGVWGRYEDADSVLDEIAAVPIESAAGLLRKVYAEPVKPELIAARVAHIKEAGVRCAVRVRPQRAAELVPHALAAEPDLLVIQGTVVSAEHVSSVTDPLNLKTLATAIADARASRMRHLDETGVYCHVIADGCMRGPGYGRPRFARRSSSSEQP